MTPFENVNYKVKKKSDNTLVAQGNTLADGKLVLNLAPGEYTVEITIPDGYVIENSALTEPGQAVINTAATIIQDVTITEGGNTTLVTNFITE